MKQTVASIGLSMVQVPQFFSVSLKYGLSPPTDTSCLTSFVPLLPSLFALLFYEAPAASLAALAALSSASTRDFTVTDSFWISDS